MTKFNKFDRANLKALHAEMEAVLQKYGMDANLEFEVGNMRFSDAEVNIKVKAKVKGAKTFTDTMLETRVKALGLKMKNSFGDELVAYKPRSYKYPFVYRTRSGQMFKCDENSVKIRFAA